MTSQLISQLRKSVESAQHPDDLAPFLKHIPLQTLKAVINSHLSSINHNDRTLIHKMYHSCISIEDIIPSRNLQSILHFLPYQKSLKSVNTTFRDLVQMNVDLTKKERAEYVASQFNGNNIWMVDPSRDSSSITNEEPANGIKRIKGIFKTFEDALDSDEFQSGDTIYLSEGTHRTKQFKPPSTKNVNVIGIGECILEYIFYEKCPEAEFRVLFVASDQKVSFTNIQMQCERIAFNIEQQGTMFLTNCTLTAFEGVQIEKESVFDCMDCTFTNNKESLSAIALNEGPSTLNVTNCVFDGCGGWELEPAIKIVGGNVNESKIKIIGNTFLNQNQSPGSRPIGDVLSTKIKLPRDAVLRNNRIADGEDDVLELFLDRGPMSIPIKKGDRRRCHLGNWCMHKAKEHMRRNGELGTDEEDDDDDEEDESGSGSGEDNCQHHGCGCCD